MGHLLNEYQRVEKCPFCGGSNLVLELLNDTFGQIHGRIRCMNCGSNGPSVQRAADETQELEEARKEWEVVAMREWNDRVVAVTRHDITNNDPNY